MAKKAYLGSELNADARKSILETKHFVDLEIHSVDLWEELLSDGLDIEQWSEDNNGNQIYLKNTEYDTD